MKTILSDSRRFFQWSDIISVIIIGYGIQLTPMKVISRQAIGIDLGRAREVLYRPE